MHEAGTSRQQGRGLGHKCITNILQINMKIRQLISYEYHNYLTNSYNYHNYLTNITTILHITTILQISQPPTSILQISQNNMNIRTTHLTKKHINNT